MDPPTSCSLLVTNWLRFRLIPGDSPEAQGPQMDDYGKGVEDNRGGRSRHLLGCWAAIILLQTSYVALADEKPAEAPHLKVELTSQDNSIRPGQDFWVGLHLTLDEGWHVYWSNPGDSGQAPSVQWDLPPGFQAGPIEWPYPERLEHAPVVDYGYEHDVLLMARIHPPSDLRVGRTVDLSANAKWLVCQEICIPGKARLTLSLPVRTDDAPPDPTRGKLFSAARRRLPRSLPANWHAAGTSDGDDFMLAISTGKPESHAVFFPLEPEQIDNATPQIATASKSGVRIRLRKSTHLLKPIASLNGVVVLSPGRAYLIHAKVRVAKQD